MSYTTTTRATLRLRLQERYESLVFWTDTEANDAINEALRQFNAYTGYWHGTVTVSTAAGDPFITLPGTLTYRSRVYTTGRTLTRKSIVEQYRGRRNWRTQTTTDGGAIPTTVREWTPIGLRMIALWPTPAAAGIALSVDGVKLTPTLSADGSYVDLGEEALSAILDEALWILGGFKRPSLVEAFRGRHRAFILACGAKNDHLRASAFYRKALGLDQLPRVQPPTTPDAEATS